MRFNRHQNPIRVFEAAPVILGLAVLLALAAIALEAQLQPRAAPYGRATRPVQEAEVPVRVAISSDGAITVGGDGKRVALEDVPGTVAASTKRRVELSIDPGARGATVDALLSRLRDAGVARCTLLVDLTAASASGRESSKAQHR